MHITRIQRDVLANVAPGTVLVLKAKQIVLVSESRHASAEAGQLFQDAWNVLRGLISGTRLLIRE